jgi:hypothetical protein
LKSLWGTYGAQKNGKQVKPLGTQKDGWPEKTSVRAMACETNWNNLEQREIGFEISYESEGQEFESLRVRHSLLFLPEDGAFPENLKSPP